EFARGDARTAAGRGRWRVALVGRSTPPPVRDRRSWVGLLVVVLDEPPTPLGLQDVVVAAIGPEVAFRRETALGVFAPVVEVAVGGGAPAAGKEARPVQHLAAPAQRASGEATGRVLDDRC